MINKVLQAAPGFLLILISLFAVVGNNHAHLDFAGFYVLVLCLVACCALFFSLVWVVTGDFTAAAKALTYFALLWLLYMCCISIGIAYFQANCNGLLSIGLFAAMAILLVIKKCCLPFSRDLQFMLLIFSLTTLLFQLPPIIKVVRSASHVMTYNDVEKSLSSEIAGHLPHIVYIIPDRYTSNEVLRTQYSYDNSAFTDALKARGFFVWDQQVSNYPKTFQSIASTMNMNYINDLADELGPTETSYVPIYRLLEDNQVLRVLKRNGYGYVHMGNWWEPTRFNQRADQSVTLDGFLSEFSVNYLAMTPAAFLNSLLDNPLAIKDICALINRQVDAIVEQTANSRKPLFFFWHLFSTHPPYLYDENGDCLEKRASSQKNPNDEAMQYLDQITHTNSILLKSFDRINALSDRDVVFVILSDEGPFPWSYIKNEVEFEFLKAEDTELRRKFGVFSALYLPSRDYENFEVEYTSINIFRLVLNEIFTASLPLLHHKSYSFNRQTYPYDLVNIKGRLNKQN